MTSTHLSMRRPKINCRVTPQTTCLQTTLPGWREKTKPRLRMTRRPKAETSLSGSLAVSAKMKIAIAATTPRDNTRELKR